MKKYLLLFSFSFFLIFNFNNLKSQSADYKLLTGKEKEESENKILQASAEVKSLKCDFIQEKKLTFLKDVQISKGVMLFKAKNSLRWEYNEPESYIFALNNTKIYLKNSKGTTHLNTNSNKILKAVSQLIVGTISGEGYKNSSDFQIEYYSSDKDYLIILKPIDKNIKKMLATIELYMDKQTFVASQMIMKEGSGDITKLKFFNVQKNVEIADKLFILN